MASEPYLILCINPGSTSTKVGVFSDAVALHVLKIDHNPEELKSFKRVSDQSEYRAGVIEEFLGRSGVKVSDLSAVVGRGGMTKPLPGGTYRVNDAMLEDLAEYSLKYYGSEHIANLGASLALSVARRAGAPAFIIDPIATDDFIPLTRLSGVPEVERVSLMHSLNLRAKARHAAAQVGKPFSDINMIGCHLGGGISMAAFEKGKAIDANHGLMGYGPFSPQRAGTLAIAAVMEMCFSGKYTPDQLRKKLGTQSGFIGYLGTDDGREIRRRIESGDKTATLVVEACALQIAKEIAALAASMSGDVQCVFITGGLANAEYLTEPLVRRIKFLAPIYVLPGEDELIAMAEGALRVLRGEETPRDYSAEDSLRARLEDPAKFKVLNSLRKE
ncbi:MAG: butyrate kinase [Candidatus Brocadiia bacterium]